jgi:hypothetical protein
MTSSTTQNGQIPTDPTTILLALLVSLCIAGVLPAEQIGAAAALYPLVHRLLAVERR